MTTSIVNNLMALNAQRQFNLIGLNKSKSTEKLSSGYKVNRAADDAAGLAISEKMRRQIRGLTQASANCQDGVSLCQVADGALNESQDILQRMNELAVKSANGTNSGEDREYIQQEVDQLIEELDRIANNTTFNEGIYPLNCPKTNWPLKEQIVEVMFEAGGSVNGVIIKPGETANLVGVTVPGSDGVIPNGVALYYDDMVTPYVTLDKYYEMSDLRLTDLYRQQDGQICYKQKDGTEKALYYHESLSWLYQNSPGAKNEKEWLKYTDEHELYIQAGAESGQHIKINLVDATASSLGVSGVDVSTSQGAQSAIESIKGAIKKVSEFRSDFGAQQNRLEHTIKNLDNVIENTTDAESAIRDTDMATEMVRMSNLNVLQQVGQSVLSQANQSKQGLLSLLQ